MKFRSTASPALLRNGKEDTIAVRFSTVVGTNVRTSGDSGAGCGSKGWGIKELITQTNPPNSLGLYG